MEETLRALLAELERFGAVNDARAGERREKMLNITPETGEFLAILIQAAKTRHILEIGTSNGYSTLWLADAVKAVSGLVVTVEVSAAKAEMARHNLEKSGLSAWTRQEVMAADQFLRQQPPAQFDLIFLDADRAQYVAWWPEIRDLLVPGGVLVVDNAISHPGEMEDFVNQVRATAGWRSLVIPIGKGEFLALKPVASEASRVQP
jgi:predicted O-methyltransferase YrrM